MAIEKDNSAALAVVSRDRLVARAEPFIRRGLIVDSADCVEVYASIAKGEDDRILIEQIGKAASPPLVAASIAAAILEEYDATDASRFRVDLSTGGQLAGSLSIRIPKRREQADPVGDALMPRTVTRVEDTGLHLVRMAMRHSEMATRMAVQSQEGRQEALAKELARSYVEIGTLRAQAMEDAARQREALREESLSAAALIESGAKAEAVRDGMGALIKWGPRLAQRMIARDKLSPVVAVLRELRPEQIEILRSSGVFDAKQTTMVVDAWERLNKDAAEEEKAAEEAAAAKAKRQAAAAAKNGKAS